MVNTVAKLTPSSGGGRPKGEAVLVPLAYPRALTDRHDSAIATCPLDALASGRAVVNGVVIVAYRGKVRAFPEMCPHASVSLADGSLDGGTVTCPGHGWRFSLEDGRALEGQRPLSLLDVHIDQDTVVVTNAPLPAVNARAHVATRIRGAVHAFRR